MQQKTFLTALLGLMTAGGLAACSSATPTPAPQPVLATGSAPAAAADETLPTARPTIPPTESASQDLARGDSQSGVEFVVTPLNLAAPGGALDFDVSMNTHSVDLSWDLAAQSTLTTDTGLEVRGLSWPVGGGHHYEGVLSFPATTADGKSLLDGAKTLTLTIRDAGAPERIFQWELSR